MKSFSITETLIYNPTLKSQKKKPIQSDIQQAKIVAYLPYQEPIQQKCNTVGMAQGVYEFNRSLMTEQQKLKCPKQMVVFLDNCCLVEKEYEENTWVFVKLEYEQAQGNFTKYNEEEDNSYIDNVITEEIALNILDHFYLSFKTFYGSINAFIFLKKLPQLQKILTHFVPAYEENNRPEQAKKLDISSYVFNSIRALPLDVNSTLKFNYFKNVLQSYDNNIADIVVFSNGLLAFSSLPKQMTNFFQDYFYGTGEPYRYQYQVSQRKIKHLTDLSQITQQNKYGTCFNSLIFGLGNTDNSVTDARLSSSLGLRRTQSNQPTQNAHNNVNLSASTSTNAQNSLDLLGLAQSQSLAFPQVYIVKNGEQQKYQMTYFLQKKMLFITFYKVLNSKEQIIFQNRFYFDNISKFSYKITELLNGIMSQSDNYRFLYCNLNTFTGKSSIQKFNIFVPELRYLWQIVQKHKQAQVATTIQNHWVYGIHRLNRILVLMIPSEIPLHKLDDFADKMYKQYFFKAYM